MKPLIQELLILVVIRILNRPLALSKVIRLFPNELKRNLHLDTSLSIMNSIQMVIFRHSSWTSPSEVSINRRRRGSFTPVSGMHPSSREGFAAGAIDRIALSILYSTIRTRENHRAVCGYSLWSGGEGAEGQEMLLSVLGLLGRLWSRITDDQCRTAVSERQPK